MIQRGKNKGKYMISFSCSNTDCVRRNKQLIEKAKTDIDDNNAKLTQLKTLLPTKEEFFELTQSHL
ncbi:MAG: hypothetical protein WAW80_01805 [Candidatus Saccharimonadales bacterium]